MGVENANMITIRMLTTKSSTIPFRVRPQSGHCSPSRIRHCSGVAELKQNAHTIALSFGVGTRVNV